MLFPEDFCKQMEQLLGTESYNHFCTAFRQDTPSSIRLNPWKSFFFKEADKPQFAADAEVFEVPWCSEGYYFSPRPTYTFDPLFHAGSYYVQEASSMFLEQVVRQYVSSPVRALDLCAAPGGKSTLLRSVLPEGSVLVSNEVMRQRAQVLAENMVKWGHPDVIVTNNDPADFSDAFVDAFQLIVVDAPCSGEGMFRKDEVAIAEWSASQVDVCVERQRRILADIWPCLQPGGVLVYSTCTFNRLEDEDNLQWLIDNFGAEPLSLDVPADWGVQGDLTGRGLSVWRFLPQYVQGEGFFLCAMRKPGSAIEIDYTPKKNKRVPKPVESPMVLRSWIQNAEQFELKLQQNGWVAIPKAWSAFYTYLQTQLRVLHAGIPLGEQKGKDVIPAHGLSMSVAAALDAFPRVEVDYIMALSYLRKETVTLPADSPRGFVLLTFRSVSLGFVKNLGNRANNLYPVEWRIRSSYIPEELRFVFR